MYCTCCQDILTKVPKIIDDDWYGLHLTRRELYDRLSDCCLSRLMSMIALSTPSGKRSALRRIVLTVQKQQKAQ